MPQSPRETGVTLSTVRDAIMLQGSIEVGTLSRQFQASETWVETLLEALVRMGKVEKILLKRMNCDTVCYGCPTATVCRQYRYRWRGSE